MKSLPTNTTNQSATMQTAIDAGEDTFLFAPGLHRFGKTLERVREGTRFICHGATIDLRMEGWGMYLHGGLTIEGGTIIGQDEKPLTLATGTGGAPSITFERVDCAVATTMQNITTIGATNSTFRRQTYWHDAVVKNCTFLADTNISGFTKFTDNTMQARLISGAGTWGLKGAIISRVRWEHLISRTNVGECLLFECVDVEDCIFEDLDFHAVSGPLIEYWDIGADNVMQQHVFRNNIIRGVTCDGPTSMGIWLAGRAENNLIEHLMLHRVAHPLRIDAPSKDNHVRNMVVVDCVPSMYSDGRHAARERFIVQDEGEETVIESLRVEGARGIPACNRARRDGETFDVKD
jgi:hypothetical protein